MKPERRFLVARSFARLIAGHLGVAAHVVEGHFRPKDARRQFIRIAGQQSELVLLTKAGEEWKSEPVSIPHEHAMALLDATAGILAFDRAVVSLGSGTEAFLHRILKPKPLDLVTIPFDAASERSKFNPPAWFGREVSDAAEYGNSAIAIDGVPHGREEISNAALNALLDSLEGGAASRPKETVLARSAVPLARPNTRPPVTKTSWSASTLTPAELSDDETIRQLAASLAPLSAAPH